MTPFTTLTSIAIPLPIKDVDTDMIIPAQYLTQIGKAGYGQHVFARLKESDADFVFNQSRFANARILLSRSNFGCGSSREHAVWALQQAGIAVIIAPSFSDIFAANAAKNGLLLICLPEAVVEDWINKAQQHDITLTVDLEAQQVTCHNNGARHHFDYDAFRRSCLLQGQDDLDYLLDHQAEIDAFKARQRCRGRLPTQQGV